MTVTTIPLTLANGQQVVPVFGAGQQGGAQQIILAASGAVPSAGTVTVEYRLAGSPAWQPVPHATANLNALPLLFAAYGSIAAYRFTIAGLSGGSDLSLWLADVAPGGFPDGAFTGNRALTTQDYTEANVKNGLQYYLQDKLPIIAAGGTHNIHFRTGAKPVIVKSRDFYTNGDSVSYQIFKAPTGVTGGAALAVQNYNDYLTPIPTTVAVTAGVSVGSPGTPWGDPQNIYNAGSVGQRIGSGLPPGGERVLAPNKSYLVQVINNGSGNAQADWFLSWYEGTPDLPLN